MNSLISTIGLAVAANAAVQPRGCQNPTVVQNFDLNAYLGLWYEIVRDKDTSYENGICNTANYSIKADGHIRVLNNEYYSDTQKWGGGEGDAYVVDATKDEGYLKVKFVPNVPAGDYKVIATDYDNYAVIYSCIGLGPFLSQEYVWVLARTPEVTEATKQEVIASLKSQIPKYDIFQNGAYTPQAPAYPCPYSSAPQ